MRSRSAKRGLTNFTSIEQDLVRLQPPLPVDETLLAGHRERPQADPCTDPLVQTRGRNDPNSGLASPNHTKSVPGLLLGEIEAVFRKSILIFRDVFEI